MGYYLSFEVPIVLRGRSVIVQVDDYYVEGADDNLVFHYRVFDADEDAEILQLTEEERELCYKAILVDLQGICDD